MPNSNLNMQLTEEQARIRLKVLTLIQEDNGGNNYFSNLWHLTDAYGRRGYTPPQGFDWSGYRDSSWKAIEEMAETLQMFYGEQI